MGKYRDFPIEKEKYKIQKINNRFAYVYWLNSPKNNPCLFWLDYSGGSNWIRTPLVQEEQYNN